MRKFLILACLFVFLDISCSPSTPIVLTPTMTPTKIPTATPTMIVENPPPCPEAELVYHPQLQQMLLVNCVENANQENPNVIWGWNGKQWQRVTEGGPLRRILGGVSYDEKRNCPLRGSADRLGHMQPGNLGMGRSDVVEKRRPASNRL